MRYVAPGCNNLVRVDKARNASTSAYINNATLTMTLYDAAGTKVSGVDGVALSYVANSNGRYEGTIPSTATLTAGAYYTLDILGTLSGATILHKRVSLLARYDIA